MRLIPLLAFLTFAGLASDAADAAQPDLKRARHCSAFTVLDVVPATLALDSAATDSLRGDEYTVCATIEPDSTVSWVSRDTTVATVASTGTVTALVTGHHAGSTYVVGTAGSHSDSSLVTVAAPAPPALACGGADVSLAPGDSVADSVAAYPAGSSFCLSAGVYRQQQITPKTGDQIIGAGPTTVLTGGRMLTSWTVSGGTWYATGQTQQGTVQSGGTCKPGYPMCKYPEQVLRDSVLLVPVASLAALTTGHFFFDYAADRIYIAQDPSGHTLEASVAVRAFYNASASGVRVANLAVQMYAAGSQGAGAIEGGARWTVDTVLGRWNQRVVVRASDHWIVRGSHFAYNGNYGMGDNKADSLLVEFTEMDHNNTSGINPGYGAGGVKFSLTRWLHTRHNNIHHNYGNGLWTDIDNIAVRHDTNTVQYNDGTGIFHEISEAAVIRGNTSCYNGQAPADALQNGAGILVSASPDVEVVGNIVCGNAHGIIALQQCRGSGLYGPHVVEHLSVHDNTVTQTNSGRAAAMLDGCALFDAYAASADNVWANNTYHRTLGLTRWHWSAGDISESAWAAVQDAGSSWAP